MVHKGMEGIAIVLKRLNNRATVTLLDFFFTVLTRTAATCTNTTNIAGTIKEFGDMEVKKYARDVKDFENFPDRSKEPQRNFTWAELAEYDGESGRLMYIAVDCTVYDITDFADFHPAGPECLKEHLGHDATAAMRATNMPKKVYTVFIKRFQVGQIVDPDTSQGC